MPTRKMCLCSRARSLQNNNFQFDVENCSASKRNARRNRISIHFFFSPLPCETNEKEKNEVPEMQRTTIDANKRENYYVLVEFAISKWTQNGAILASIRRSPSTIAIFCCFRSKCCRRMIKQPQMVVSYRHEVQPNCRSKRISQVSSHLYFCILIFPPSPVSLSLNLCMYLALSVSSAFKRFTAFAAAFVKIEQYVIYTRRF